MNIKGLIYARYSTSVKINSIVKEASNKSLAADIDKVTCLSFSFPKKQKPSKPKPTSAINSKRRMVYGMSLTMTMTLSMLSAPVRNTLNVTPMVFCKNCSRK